MNVNTYLLSHQTLRGLLTDCNLNIKTVHEKIRRLNSKITIIKHFLFLTFIMVVNKIRLCLLFQCIFLYNNLESYRMNVQIYMSMHAFLCTYRIKMRIKYIFIYRCTRKYKYVHIQIQIRINIYICTCIHKYMYVYIHMLVKLYQYAYACV
jgi:hypothetical protein